MKEPIVRLRHHIKTLAEREDYLRSQLKITALEGRYFIEQEADALAWALKVLVPLVQLQEAKAKREAARKTQETEVA
jgi:hypothetical protein